MSQITNQEKFYINKCIIKMESNDTLTIKNRACYHFYDIIKIENFDPDR